jgi:hypothetical protein
MIAMITVTAVWRHGFEDGVHGDRNDASRATVAYDPNMAGEKIH